MSKIELKHLTKRFGDKLALNNVSLSIEAGEVFVLMGLSGSGKSTLIRHINRLIEPDAGDILFDGDDVRAFDAEALRQFRRHKVSMVFQGYGLMPHMSVLENVGFGLIVRGETPAEAQPKAMAWLKTVGLEDQASSSPATLSGGMQQRVGLARALATQTDVILMDEAFSALDPLTRADMQDLLLDLQARLKKTIIFVTHDLDEAVRLGTRIAVMKAGAIVQTGTPQTILENPADDYVARFVAIRNR